MSKKSLALMIACAAVVLIGVRAVAAPATTVEKTPSLEQLASLAGDWVALDENGEPTEQVVSRYRVTAGGNAVLETLFPGSDHEMITVYYQDGDELVLNHYCVLGKHPRMRARMDGERLRFDCTGGANIHSAEDAHMHEGVVEFEGPDRYRSEWNQYKDGEKVYTASFHVARRKEKASR